MELSSYISFVEFTLKNRKEAFSLGLLAYNTAHKINTQNDYSFLNALDNNIIQGEGTYTFVKPKALSFFYTLHFIETNCKNKRGENAWAAFINQLVSENNRAILNVVRYDFYALVILITNRVYHINIAKLIFKKKITINRIVMISVFDTLSFLEADTKDLVDCLLIATKEIKAEDNYFQLDQSVRITSFNKQDFGNLIIKKSKEDSRKSRLFIPHAFLGLTEKLGLENTFKYLKEYLNSKEVEEIKLGLWCLRMLTSNQSQFEDYKEKIIKLLGGVEKLNLESLHGDLILTHGSFIKLLPAAPERILKIRSTANSDEAFYALSNIIYFSVNENYEKNWFQDALKTLVNLNSRPIGCYSILSNTFIKILERKPELVFEYFNQFISHPKNDPKNIEGFKDVFTNLLNKNLPLLQKWITLWLNNDNSKFHAAVSEICSRLHKNYELELDKEILDTLSIFDIEFILYKIVGYYFSEEHLASLTFSATNYEGKHYEVIGNLFVQLFINYILYNFSSSLNYLKSKKDNVNEYQKELINRIEQYYEELYRSKRNKPKELSPSPERLQLFFNQTTKNLSLEQNISPFRETSILDFVSKVVLKIGTSFFLRDEKNFQTIKNFNSRSTMSRISTSFDMPTEFTVDPVGMEFNRFVWRNFKRRIK